MSDINRTGPSAQREGSQPVIFGYSKNSSGSANVSATPIIINASSLNPVYIDGAINIAVPSDGTAPTVGIGTTTAGTELIGLINATGIGVQSQLGKAVATDLTTIYIREGGTPDGSGVYHVIIKAFSINTQPTN